MQVYLILSMILDNYFIFLNNKIPSVLSIQAFTVNTDIQYLEVLVLFYIYKVRKNKPFTMYYNRSLI